MRRDRVVSVRVTDDEHEQLRRRAEWAGVRLSDLIRNGLFREPPPAVPIPGYGSGTVTLPNLANVIWLTDGHADGGTFTLAA